MLSSRCVRCGAVGRYVLRATGVDHLIAYRPLWLDPGLLPSPSLLDLVATRDAAIVSSDGSVPAVERPYEDLPEMPSMDLEDEDALPLPAPAPFPPDPVPRPDPPLPLPEPFPEPIPEPEPEPEEPPRTRPRRRSSRG